MLILFKCVLLTLLLFMKIKNNKIRFVIYFPKKYVRLFNREQISRHLSLNYLKSL